MRLDDLADRLSFLTKPGINTVTALRLVMGWIFFSSGLSKLAGNGLEYSYASEYLTQAVPITTPSFAFSFPEILQVPGLMLVKAGAFIVEPLMQVFGSLQFIGPLVIITELFIGLSLLLGLFTRIGSITGVFMMLMFYYGNADWSHGLLNSDIVYLTLLLALISLNAERNLSLDSYITEKYEIENKALKALFGAR
jgi:thiosulfate dehydrogenase [quinone] large subunit